MVFFGSGLKLWGSSIQEIERHWNWCHLHRALQWWNTMIWYITVPRINQEKDKKQWQSVQGVEAGRLSVSDSSWPQGQRCWLAAVRSSDCDGRSEGWWPSADSICLVPSPVATELSWSGTSFLEVKGIYYWGAQETFGLLRWWRGNKYMFWINVLGYGVLVNPVW